MCKIYLKILILCDKSYAKKFKPPEFKNAGVEKNIDMGLITRQSPNQSIVKGPNLKQFY